METFYRNPVVILTAVLVALIAIVVLAMQAGPLRSFAPMSSAERAEQLAKDGKREQIITVSDGMIPLHEPTKEGASSTSRLFAIPIGQIALAEPQTFSKLSRGGSYRAFRANGAVWAYEDQAAVVYGSFSNLIIYDKTDGSLKKIFDTRIAISAFQFISRVAPRVLVITATSDDSDGDGAVDRSDIQSLYVYTFEHAQLHKISGIEGSAGVAVAVGNADDLIVEVTLDSDRDGNTGERAYKGGKGPEPQRLFRVDLRTFAATPLMDQNLLDDLQATLDGARPSVPKMN